MLNNFFLKGINILNVEIIFPPCSLLIVADRVTFMFCTASFRRRSTWENSVISLGLHDTVEQNISWLMIEMLGSDTEVLISLIRLAVLLITSAQLESLDRCCADPVNFSNLARTALALTLLAYTLLTLLYKVRVIAEVFVRHCVARS